MSSAVMPHEGCMWGRVCEQWTRGKHLEQGFVVLKTSLRVTAGIMRLPICVREAEVIYRERPYRVTMRQFGPDSSDPKEQDPLDEIPLCFREAMARMVSLE